MNSSSMSSAVPTIKCEDTSPSPSAAVGNEGEGTYNLSVNVNFSSSTMINLLSAESAGTTTLRTPEIVNDVITMTNPLDQLDQYNQNSNFKPGCGQDSNSSMSNGSSVTSPASSTTPSIQKTCSELIKAGLKLSIESKRKMSGSDTDASVKRMKKEESDDEYDSSNTLMPKSEGLTPEDEERRRRRRERNKIAATKCRMKKRERTCNLVQESEVLESQNVDLKAQLKGVVEVGYCSLNYHLHKIGHTDSPLCRGCMEDNETVEHALLKCKATEEVRQKYLPMDTEVCMGNQPNSDDKTEEFKQDLEVQKRQLIDMLAGHAASCVKNNTNTRSSPTCPYPIRSFESPTTFPNTYEAHSPYIRPESANILTSSYTCTPINADNIDNITSIDTLYVAPLLDNDYSRPDSVLSLPANSEANYVTTDGYLPKTMMVPIEEHEYYDAEINYNLTPNQQCHTYPVTVSETQSKHNGLNDGCLV